MLTGIALKILSTVAFVLMSTMVRYLGDSVPAGQVVFARSAFAMIPVMLWLAYRGVLRSSFATQSISGHALRSIIGVTSMFCGFSALARIPLPDATAISYASPLITVILAVILLGERVRVYRWTAVAIGLTGVVVILWPHLVDGELARVLFDRTNASRAGQGAAFALVGAFLTAGAMIQVRRLTLTEKTGTIVTYFSLFSALVGLLTLPFGWIWPDGRTLVILVSIGIVGGIGQILLTECYRYADASLIAPFEYTSMLWAVTTGFLVFGDLPTIYVAIGSLIVIGSGIFVIYRERKLGIRREAQRQAAPPSNG